MISQETAEKMSSVSGLSVFEIYEGLGIETELPICAADTYRQAFDMLSKTEEGSAEERSAFLRCLELVVLSDMGELLEWTETRSKEHKSERTMVLLRWIELETEISELKSIIMERAEGDVVAIDAGLLKWINLASTQKEIQKAHSHTKEGTYPKRMAEEKWEFITADLLFDAREFDEAKEILMGSFPHGNQWSNALIKMIHLASIGQIENAVGLAVRNSWEETLAYRRWIEMSTNASEIAGACHPRFRHLEEWKGAVEKLASFFEAK